MTDTIRERLQAAEEAASHTDALMRRVLDAMKDHTDLMDEIEQLERRRLDLQAAAATFVVEAAFALMETAHAAA